MNEDLINLPNLNNVSEMLVMARRDIEAEVEQDAELLEASTLLLQVISIMEEKIASKKDTANLSLKEKIDFAAHLNFLQELLEDFFFFEDLDDSELEECEEECDHLEEES